MDNTLISARVPRAKKERAASILASIGATTSDLINSAVEYVIANKALPAVKQPEARDAHGFEAFVNASTVAVAWPDDVDGDYKSLAARFRLADYEALN